MTTKLDGIMIWVADVPTSVRFYDEAFGIAARWVRDEGDYAQLETGETTLQLAALAAAPTSGLQITPHQPDGPAAAVQLSLAVDDVLAAVTTAVKAGAVLAVEPVTKPWGQVVAYLRDRDGVLIELTGDGQ
ncbi:VOC family protein [Nocardioides rubriscoriae]|uniref:VOC family protein n=1 Tax=Nocardioides rubriscoriae TaxID=642762 RepID=UPI0011DF11A5|nr:VOC family protein [Nocardioides rubriscoriae]